MKDNTKPTVRKLWHWIVGHNEFNQIIQRSQLPYLFHLLQYTHHFLSTLSNAKQLHFLIQINASFSDLVVASASLTAVYKIQTSNPTVSSCVYHDSHCNIQP